MISPCVAFTRLLESLYPEISVLLGVVYHAVIGVVVDDNREDKRRTIANFPRVHARNHLSACVSPETFCTAANYLCAWHKPIRATPTHPSGKSA